MCNGDILSASFFAACYKNKSIRFILNGKSMQPVLCEGDALIAKPITFCEAQFGDILAYQNVSTKKITVHRVVKTKRQGNGATILTAAEAGCRFVCDQPLTPAEYILTRVICIERGSRRIHLTGPVNSFKAKFHTFVLVHFHFLMRIRQKLHSLVGGLFRQG